MQTYYAFSVALICYRASELGLLISLVRFRSPAMLEDYSNLLRARLRIVCGAWMVAGGEA